MNNTRKWINIRKTPKRGPTPQEDWHKKEDHHKHQREGGSIQLEPHQGEK